MKKRLTNSKPLIISLASAISVAAIAGVSTTISVGISQNNSLSAMQNRIQFAPEAQFPNLNTTNRSMFQVSPSNISTYNGATVLKGQTSTPYGWIGIPDDSAGGETHEVALINWSGEVIWRTDLRTAVGGTNNMPQYAHIHDIKYEPGTNTVTVLTSNKKSGAFDTNQNNDQDLTNLYILDATSGKPLGWSTWVQNDFIKEARRILKDYGAYSVTSDRIDNTNFRLQDLYSIDVVGNFNLKNKDIGQHRRQEFLVNYGPNLMQLSKGNESIKMDRALQDFSKINFTRMIFRNNNGFGMTNDVIQSSLWDKLKAVPELDKNNASSSNPNQMRINGRNQIEWIVSQGKTDYVEPTQMSLLTSPFWSGLPDDTNNNSFYFLHFFFRSNDNQRVFHSVLQFRVEPNKGLTLVATKMEQLSGKNMSADEIRRSPLSQFQVSDNIDWTRNQNNVPADFILKHPANTKVNHNMFQPEFVTFAFPTTSVKWNTDNNSGNNKTFYLPLYDVAQVIFNAEGKISPTNNNLAASRIFKIGTEGGYTSTYINNAPYQFSRLLSVSPFDNSFVYLGAKSEANTNKLNGWIVRSGADRWAQRFSIDNVDSNKSSYEKLWKEGFGFDPYLNLDQTAKINLYYNHNKHQENYGAPDGFTSNQIGMLGQFNQQMKQSSFNIASKQNADINANSYASIIFSRPNFEQWYPITSFNLQNPANLFNTNQKIINGNQDLFAIGKNWKPTGGNQIDVVSHLQKSITMDNYRVVKSPEFVIANEPNMGSSLKIKLYWNTSQANFDTGYSRFNGLKAANNKLRFEKTFTITNPSYQILNKFGAPTTSGLWSQKMKNWSGKINNINLTTDSWDASKQAWWDIRNNPISGATNAQQLFGKVNNAQNINNKAPLRIMAQLVMPGGNPLPDWFNQFKATKGQYWQPAPLVAFGNEKTFNVLMSEFATDLIKNINNKATANQSAVALGLANFKINIFYQLNPAVANNSKVYGDDNRQIILNNNQAIIYENYQSATIYDQNATSFLTMKDSGLVDANIRANWSTLPTSTKLTYEADATNLLWPIVDTGQSFQPSNKEKIFQAEYDQSRKNIKIKAANPSLDLWFKKTLTTMNFTYGFQLVFEAKASGSTTWTTIDSTKFDQDYAQIYDDNTKTLTLPTTVSNFKTIRIRLIPINPADQNQFINWINLTEAKQTSAEVSLGADVIKFDQNWINTTPLTTTHTIDQLEVNDFTTWEQKIKTQFETNNLQVQNVWDKLEIKYHFNNQTFTLNNLLSYLKAQAQSPTSPNQGWWYLWVGTTGDTSGLKIEVSFAIKSQFQNDYDLVNSQNQPITSDQTKTPIDAKIKRNFDFKPYFDQLQQNALVATLNNNQIDRIEMPSGNTGLFNQLSFDDIKTKINRVGIKFQFQAWDNGNWTNKWVDDLALIKTYNLAQPQFKIRAILRDQVFSNTTLTYGTNALDQNGYLIDLQLPKLIVGPQDIQTQLTKLIQTDQPLGGNTKFLTLTNINQFENKIYQLIKTASSFQDDHFKNFLKIQYQIGQTNQWDTLENLKTQLATNTGDLNSNQVDLKFVLENINTTHPEYTLSQQLNNQTFTLYQDQNQSVKIYIHGQKWEQNINQINASGATNNITYNIPNAFDDLRQNITTGAKLEWKFDITSDSTWKAYPNQSLPNNIQDQYPTFVNAKAIKIRVSHDTNDNIYHYGPEQDPVPFRQEGTIDLTNLAKNVVVNRDWFNQHQLVGEQISQLVDWTTINEQTFVNWEAEIKKLIKTDDQTKALIQIQYNIVWPNQTQVANTTWSDANTIINQINQAFSEFTNPLHYGLINFYDQSRPQNNQVKLVAKFVSVDPNHKINFIDQNNQPITDEQMLQSHINTSWIATTFDLTTYWNKLLNQPTKVVVLDPSQGTIKDQRVFPPDADNSGLFANQSFDNINQMLNAYQVKIVFNNQLNNQNPNWIENGAIDRYDPQNPRLGIAIVNNSFNLKIKLDAKNLLSPNTDSKAANHQIKLQVPKLVDLQQSWFDAFKASSGFSGDTKNLIKDDQAIANLLANLKSELKKINPDLEQAPLEIKFQLGSSPISNANELVNYLANLNDDQNTNEIKMQVSFTAGTSSDEWILQGFATQNPETVFAANNPIKIFLHDHGIWDSLNKPQISGTNQKLQWNFNNLEVNPTSGIINKPNKQNALKVQYRLDANQAWQDRQIIQVPAGQQSLQIQLTWANPDYQNKFVFEDGVITKATNSHLNQSITVDLSNLKSTLILQSQWLDQIKATGDLINLQLDESRLRQTLTNNNVLVPAELDNLIVEYSIDGQKWYDKIQFETFLQTNQGKLNNSRFILKREEIKTRFGLKAGTNPNKYNWEIDQIAIQNLAQYQNHYRQLISDTINSNVKGVINLELVPDFTKTNFSIRGTNLNPLLEVQNKANILNKLNPYASEHLFRILLSTTKDQQNNFQWNNPITIYDQGDFITKLPIKFKDLKNAAIKFEAFDPTTQSINYLVKSDKNQPTTSEFVFDISDQISVVTEIINPFTKANKKLAIQVRNDQNQAQWMQGQGRFKIMVGDSNWQIDPINQSAGAFIANDQSLTENEKSKLEFAYYIFESQPTNDEILAAQANLNSWNSFTNPSDWSDKLNLKVGNYVTVALRVKKQFATGDQAFVLKDNDYSFLMPVNEHISNPSEPIAKRHPGRISGLLIDPTTAQVQANVQLKATNPTFTKQLVDGWVQLDQLQIQNDQNQASGLDLQLELFNEFHLDSQDQVLVSGSNALLVKRDHAGATQGAQYVDQGGKPIVDKENNPVYLWIDNATNKPAKPIEKADPTQSVQLKQQKDGIYRFENQATNPLVFNLFKNQKINIKYQAKVGLGDETTPDFALTQTFSQDIKEFVNPQIKFVLENPQNIIYEWKNRNSFADGIVQFEPTNENDQIATEGQARVKTILELNRKLKNDNNQNTTITDPNSFTAAQKINDTIIQDFNNQLQFKIERTNQAGETTVYNNSANIYQINDLKNRDQIRLSLMTTDPDLVYLDAPQPLVINVNNLATSAPDRKALRFLRVEQSGTIDGQGSFRVLINDPSQPLNKPDQSLKGWKFKLRVWAPNRSIKLNWTDDQSLITNLSNGDKIEWKLVDGQDNPVTDAYYNTIAMAHDEANNQYNFAQVNYPKGQNDLQIVKTNIGTYPQDDNTYPEDSGFVISNLIAKDQVKPFNLSQLAFEKVIKTLNPTYRGQNGNGALVFNDTYLKGTWYIDLEGNLYQNPKYPNQNPTNLQEITLANFFANTTFYLENPITNPAQVGFKFKANITNTGNQLKNGDQVFAQFDVEGAGLSAAGIYANNSINEPVITSSLVSQLPDVANLVDATDPLAPLWWILAIILTIGLAGLVWLIVNKWKNPKLEVKNVKKR